jgi:hypothetical protein
MTDNVKTLLIVGGIAVVAYIAYKSFTGKGRVIPGTVAAGGGQVTAPQAGAGSATSFWDTLGNVGKGLNEGVSSVESTYNNIYDLFGGQPTTSAPPVTQTGSP